MNFSSTRLSGPVAPRTPQNRAAMGSQAGSLRGVERSATLSISKEQLRNWFTYHSPSETQNNQYEQIRHAGLNLAEVIVNLTPESADQTDAVRKVREAVMTANAAIACGTKMAGAGGPR